MWWSCECPRRQIVTLVIKGRGILWSCNRYVWMLKLFTLHEIRLVDFWQHKSTLVLMRAGHAHGRGHLLFLLSLLGGIVFSLVTALLSLLTGDWKSQKFTECFRGNGTCMRPRPPATPQTVYLTQNLLGEWLLALLLLLLLSVVSVVYCVWCF